MARLSPTSAHGEDVESEMVAAFGTFVGLLGQDRSYVADDRFVGGEEPTESVHRRISRLSRSAGMFDQIWIHTSFGKLVKAKT